MPPLIQPRHALSATEISALEDRLYEYNQRATGHDDGKQWGFVASDKHGAQIGAMAGYTWAGMAEIKQLWVDEPHRGQGLGSSLLASAIAEIRMRRCRCVWVLSHTFQAPRFYEKYGFERVAEFADWPPGHGHTVLRRQLD